jgi:hypothetical protein
LTEIDTSEFKRRFPNLAKEIELGSGTFDLGGVDGADIFRKARDSFAGYMPTAIDYLRRCDDEKQAEETIDYLEKKADITGEEAGQLRKKLKEQGLRSFGTRKENDYYLKKSGHG